MMATEDYSLTMWLRLSQKPLCNDAERSAKSPIAYCCFVFNGTNGVRSMSFRLRTILAVPSL